jgi:hypothetical protein
LSKHFKWGRESIEDDHHPGRPVEVTTLEMCQKNEDLIMQDRCLKVTRNAQECSMSEPFNMVILHKHLGMSKVSSHWVPKMLTPLQKQCRVQFFEENLGFYDSLKNCNR